MTTANTITQKLCYFCKFHKMMLGGTWEIVKGKRRFMCKKCRQERGHAPKL